MQITSCRKKKEKPFSLKVCIEKRFWWLKFFEALRDVFYCFLVSGGSPYVNLQ